MKKILVLIAIGMFTGVGTGHAMVLRLEAPKFDKEPVKTTPAPSYTSIAYLFPVGLEVGYSFNQQWTLEGSLLAGDPAKGVPYNVGGRVNYFLGNDVFSPYVGGTAEVALDTSTYQGVEIGGVFGVKIKIRDFYPQVDFGLGWNPATGSFSWKWEIKASWSFGQYVLGTSYGNRFNGGLGSASSNNSNSVDPPPPPPPPPN